MRCKKIMEDRNNITTSTVMSLEERMSFINGLELSEAPEGILHENENGSASVTEGTIVSFVKGITEQSKADVLNSMLLAQLAANKKFDKEKQTIEWYNFYGNVLQNVGWVIQQWDFEKYQASSSVVDLGDVITNVLLAIAGASEIKAIKATIAAVRALSGDSKPGKIFDTSTHSSEGGHFRLASCVEDEGTISTALGCIYFSTTETVTSIFWMKFNSEAMKLYQSGQQIVLNKSVYNQVRNQIIAKLGDRAHQYIADLDI